MASLWYFRKNDRNFGPITSVVLRQLTEAAIIEPEDLVRKKGIHKWSRAKFVKNLYGSGLPSQEAEKEQASNEPFVEYAEPPPSWGVEAQPEEKDIADPFAALLNKAAVAQPPSGLELPISDQGQAKKEAEAAPVITRELEIDAEASDVITTPNNLEQEEPPEHPRPSASRRSFGHRPSIATKVFAPSSKSQVLSSESSTVSDFGHKRQKPGGKSRGTFAEESATMEEWHSSNSLKWLLITAIVVMVLGIAVVIYLLTTRPPYSAGVPVGTHPGATATEVQTDTVLTTPGAAAAPAKESPSTPMGQSSPSAEKATPPEPTPYINVNE